MNDTYTAPALEIIEFSTEDVITQSLQNRGMKEEIGGGDITIS